jgi:hypothetical protein
MHLEISWYSDLPWTCFNSNVLCDCFKFNRSEPSHYDHCPNDFKLLLGSHFFLWCHCSYILLVAHQVPTKNRKTPQRTVFRGYISLAGLRRKFPTWTTNMTSNNTIHSLPNPFTPLAFLRPTTAQQFEVSTYICVASLSVRIKPYPLPRFPLSLLTFRRHTYGIGCCRFQKRLKYSVRESSVYQWLHISALGESCHFFHLPLSERQLGLARSDTAHW